MSKLSRRSLVTSAAAQIHEARVPTRAAMAIKGRVIHVDADSISVRLDIPRTEIGGDGILKDFTKRGVEWI